VPTSIKALKMKPVGTVTSAPAADADAADDALEVRKHAALTAFPQHTRPPQPRSVTLRTQESRADRQRNR
jgi:hypothetical protein